MITGSPDCTGGGEVPEGLSLYTFPESDWAMFSAKGPLPGSLQALNTQVWQEWYPDEGGDFLAEAAPCCRSTPPVTCKAPIMIAASGCRSVSPPGETGMKL